MVCILLHVCLTFSYVTYKTKQSRVPIDAVSRVYFHGKNATLNRLSYYAIRYIACQGRRLCTMNSTKSPAIKLEFVRRNAHLMTLRDGALCYFTTNLVHNVSKFVTWNWVANSSGVIEYGMPFRSSNIAGFVFYKLFKELRNYHGRENADYGKWKPKQINRKPSINRKTTTLSIKRKNVTKSHLNKEIKNITMKPKSRYITTHVYNTWPPKAITTYPFKNIIYELPLYYIGDKIKRIKSLRQLIKDFLIRTLNLLKSTRVKPFLSNT